MPEDFDQPFVLTDEEGNEISVEILNMIDYEGKTYVAMTEVFENPEEMLDSECEFFVFEVVNDEEGMGFQSVEDEDLLDTLAAQFEEMLNSEEDEDDLELNDEK